MIDDIDLDSVLLSEDDASIEVLVYGGVNVLPGSGPFARRRVLPRAYPWRDQRQQAAAIFLVLYTDLMQRYGAPDFPRRGIDCDYRESFGAESDFLAVWEHDYYRTSLRIEVRDHEPTVVLAKHTNR